MTETKVRAGEKHSQAYIPGAEVKTAMSGFLEELKEFQVEIKQKLQHQEERLTMLNQKTMSYGRPALSTCAEAEAPHQKAFDAYIRSGDDDGLRGLVLEGKGMNTAVAAEGGYLVDPHTVEAVRSIMRSAASLRSVSRVVHVDANSFDVIVDSTDLGAGWADETTATSETTAPMFERISIPLHELSAMPKSSQRLLDDAAFDVEAWLAERIAEKFLRSEAAAFISGDGSGKPTGFLSHDKVDNSSWAWGKIGYVSTGTDGDFASSDPADALIDLVYSLDAAYRAGATFIMNSKTAGAARKMRDNDGRFLWADGLATGEAPRLMGYPVLIAEDMPDIDDDSYSIAFGDFGAGYTVVERPDMRVLRDPYSAKPHVLFYATKRVGGDVSDYAAIKLLKFAAS